MTYRASNGIWRTSSLFYERNADPNQISVFSLHEDREGLINARKTYVELEDPTGYQWAMKYLDSWTHMQKLMRLPWFIEAKESWDEELFFKLRSEAISKIKEIGEGESSLALSAQKYLAERGWEKTESKRGRPTKTEVKGELKRQAQLLEVEDEDMERIGLRVVGGRDFKGT